MLSVSFWSENLMQWSSESRVVTQTWNNKLILIQFLVETTSRMIYSQQVSVWPQRLFSLLRHWRRLCLWKSFRWLLHLVSKHCLHDAGFKLRETHNQGFIQTELTSEQQLKQGTVTSSDRISEGWTDESCQRNLLSAPVLWTVPRVRFYNPHWTGGVNLNKRWTAATSSIGADEWYAQL